MTVWPSSTQAVSLPEGCCPTFSGCETYGRFTASGRAAAFGTHPGPNWKHVSLFLPKLDPKSGACATSCSHIWAPLASLGPNSMYVSPFGPYSGPNWERVSLFEPKFEPAMRSMCHFVCPDLTSNVNLMSFLGRNFAHKSGACVTICAQIRAEMFSLCHFLCPYLCPKSDTISRNGTKFGPKK